MISKSLKFIHSPFWKMFSKNYTFTLSYNPLTCSSEWCPESADYDYIQEISRSGYGDMLWDQERNRLYHKAIIKSVHKLLQRKPSCDKLNVIDIGTGTGLLSLMVCKSFDLDLKRLNLTAFECFKPIANCAQKVITKNGYQDYIKIVNKRSNETFLSEDQKADLLVTEVFDTELIGEGALRIISWALNHQLKPDALIVPSKARIWIQLFSSSWLYKGSQFDLGSSSNIIIPKMMLNCLGSNHLHDLQANQLDINQDVQLLTDPKIIFTFDFRDLKSIKYFDHQTVEFVLNSNIDGHIMVLFWWDLFMDDDEEYLLSCSPYWTRQDSDQKSLPWRDHWMQAVYYFPSNLKPLQLAKGDKVQIDCYHDEYSFWFNHKSSALISPSSVSSANFCTCDHHFNRNRLRILNDYSRLLLYYQKLVNLLKLKNGNIKICFLGDSSLIPIKIAKEMTDCDIIYVLTKKLRSNQTFYNEFGEANNCLEKLVQIDDLSQLPEEIILDAVIAEPYFNNTNLPWDTLHYWYLLTRLKESNHINLETIIMPEKGSIKALPVCFEDLWKIRAKLGTDVEGFDLTDFDEMLEQAMQISDAVIESHSLWEYPCTALTTSPIELFKWNFKTSSIYRDSKFSCSKLINIKNDDQLKNICLTFWIEYYWDDEKWSTGLLESATVGSKLKWNKEWKQGVAFLCSTLCKDFNSDYNILVNFEYIASMGLLTLTHQLSTSSDGQV